MYILMFDSNVGDVSEDKKIYSRSIIIIVIIIMIIRGEINTFKP